MFLSVVIPCYNEEENLKRGVLEKVVGFLKREKFSWEVIISDDGSSDRSKEIIKDFIKKESKFRFRLLENRHLGKPFAVKKGIMEAKGEVILFTDLDQSTPISEVKKLLPFFKKGYQVVIGSRGAVRKNAPWYRKMMAVIFLNLRRLVILPDIIDTQCGFKAFSKKAARDIFSNLKIYSKEKEIKGGRVTAFDVEVLFLAKKRGYRVREVKVLWQYAKTEKIDYFKESISMASETFRVLVNNWRGLYDGKK